jgi:sigma-B regulation protein RsbU (phosphoserine phosphatase)
MLLLLSLLFFGVAALLVVVVRQRRAVDRAEEDRQQMQQERERVVDFMHHMVEALGEGLTRQELLQRIVHASILCSGALSACIFERTERDTLRAVAVEGLFPPHRPLSDLAKSKLTTRAKFIEQVVTASSAGWRCPGAANCWPTRRLIPIS